MERVLTRRRKIGREGKGRDGIGTRRRKIGTGRVRTGRNGWDNTNDCCRQQVQSVMSGPEVRAMIDCLYRSILKDLSSQVENMKHYTSFFIQGNYGKETCGKEKNILAPELLRMVQSLNLTCSERQPPKAMMIANLRDGT